MRQSKYINGSKITSYRLPIDKFDEVNKRITQLLKEYEGNTITVNAIKTTTIVCGCTYEGSLFRRNTTCKIPKDKHKR